jgi:hypothetical protein
MTNGNTIKTKIGGGVGGNVTTVGGDVGGDVTGGNKTVQIQQNVRNELAPVAQAIAAAPPETRQQAEQELAKIEEEAAKGDKADDTRLGGLVEGLVGLVPQAASALAAAFGGPILSGIAGPVTKFVIAKIKRMLEPGSA